MVVTRQSNQHDAAEPGENATFSQVDDARGLIHGGPPLNFTFQPPSTFPPLSPVNSGEEFDIAEEGESVQCDSETRDTASEMTDFATRSDSPSRGGTDVVRLLNSLHDLSRQMEVTMDDLRARLGSQIGTSAYDSGDYDSHRSDSPREGSARKRLTQMKGVVTHTLRGVMTRTMLLWQLFCLRFPAMTERATNVARRLRPYLPFFGYAVLAHVFYSVYQTHSRLLEQKQRAAGAWV